MFVHKHPYPPFIPENATRLIVGTLPPPRFSNGVLRADDVDFCYGSADNLLWPILAEIYGLNFRYDNSAFAIRERQDLLVKEKIGICDIVHSCQRQQRDASDLGMKQICLRDMLAQLAKYQSVNTLLFVGGNSRNGPEYLFRKQLKKSGIPLKILKKKMPRIHHFFLAGRRITTCSLISPSNAANRAIGANTLYKRRKAEDKSYSTFDFRVEQYQKIFFDERLS